MKKVIFLILNGILVINFALKSQDTPYKKQQNLSQGWNTWNSVLSHVLLPSGFALNLGVKEYEEGFYLKESLIGRYNETNKEVLLGLISLNGEGNEQILPGPRSCDGYYTELELNWRGIKLKVQSASSGDTLVLIITPIKKRLKTPLLIVEGGILWNNPGYVAQENVQLIAHLSSKNISVYANKPSERELNLNTNAPYLALSLNEPIVISTARIENAEAYKFVAAHREKIIQQEAAFANLKEVYEPLHRILPWNIIFDPDNKRVISPVSRNWKWGGFVLFNWDTYFASYMYSLDSKELAYANAVEVTQGITPDGFVPNLLYRKYCDRWLFEEVYNDLLSWNRWWFKSSLNQSLLSWGSNPYEPITGNSNEYHGINRAQGGGYESGLDNSPRYENMPFDTVRHYLNPKNFMVIPSLERLNPSYPENNYLKGRTWPPLNFLVYLGMRKYNLPDARKDLVEKSKRLLLKEWVEKGHIHECCNSDTGEGCDMVNSDKYYHWGFAWYDCIDREWPCAIA